MFNIQYSIYKLLKEAQEQEDETLLKRFNIQFPSQRIAESSNNIFIGLSEVRASERTHQSQFYEEMIDIIIVTRQKRYLEASKIYDAVTDKILEVLRSSDLYEDRLNWTSFKHQYNPQTNELQLSELLISIRSDEEFNLELSEELGDDFELDIIGIIEGYTDETPYSYVESVTGFVKNESDLEIILVPPSHIGSDEIIVQPNGIKELQVGTYNCILQDDEFSVRVNHNQVSRIPEE